MPVLNQIQGGRWDEILRRLFSMKQGAVSPTVAAEIVANIILENDRPENLALAGTRLWSIPLTQVAVAAEFQMSQVFNPADSGVISVVTTAQVASSATTTALMFLGVTALADASLSAVKMDSRLIDFAVGATFRPTTQGRDEDAAGSVAGTLISHQRTLANVMVEMLERPVILKPGTGLFIRAGAQNVTINTLFQGYERALNPSEEFER